MLIVTRRAGEKIMLGDDIVVEIMEIHGNTVRVGIAAPRSLPVWREEIWDAVRDENRAAASSVVQSLSASSVVQSPSVSDGRPDETQFPSVSDGRPDESPFRRCEARHAVRPD